MATGPAPKQVDDWQTVEADDWQTVPAAPMAEVRAIPRWSDPGGVAYHLRDIRNRLINQLPAAGGFAGGLIGAGAGAESGPGAVATAALGAGAGGVLGEDARQVIMEKLYPNAPKMGALEAGARLAGQGALQAGNEVAGQVGGRLAGRVVRPVADRFPILQRYPILRQLFAVGDKTSPNAAQHLTAAAANKQRSGEALEAIGNTLGDIEQEMQKLPTNERNVDGFLKAVNSRKDTMNAEAGAAMLPIAGKKTVPTGIANNIQNLIRSHMDNTAVGRSQRAYLMKRAAEFNKPWSYRALDELRTDLASQLDKHNSREAVSKYTAEKGDLDLAIDNAILDGLRDTVYPEMDRAAGKPVGYFADLKKRQSSLIRLQKILNQRVKDLKGAQAVSEVTPRLSSENISLSAHAGSLPRAGVYGIKQMLAPKRELKEASKHVAKAFPTVNSLPYQVLFSAGVRASEVKGPAPRRQQQEQNPTDAYAGTGVPVE